MKHVMMPLSNEGQGEGKRFIGPSCAEAPGWIPDECHGGLDKMDGLKDLKILVVRIWYITGCMRAQKYNDGDDGEFYYHYYSYFQIFYFTHM